MAPSLDGAGVEAVVHRCGRCCGAAGACTRAGGVAEGWKARTKVAEMFGEMQRLWGSERAWFLKLDADSTLVPHNLRALLAEVTWLLGAAAGCTRRPPCVRRPRPLSPPAASSGSGRSH